MLQPLFIGINVIIAAGLLMPTGLAGQVKYTSIKNIHLAERGTPLKGGSFSACVNVVVIDRPGHGAPAIRFEFDGKSDAALYVSAIKIADFKSSAHGFRFYEFQKPGIYKLIIEGTTAKTVALTLAYATDTTWDIRQVPCK